MFGVGTNANWPREFRRGMNAYIKTGKVPFAFQRQLDQERDEMEKTGVLATQALGTRGE